MVYGPLKEPDLLLIQDGIAGRTTAPSWTTRVLGYHDQVEEPYKRALASAADKFSQCLRGALLDEE
jgi:hypothetical protein